MSISKTLTAVVFTICATACNQVELEDIEYSQWGDTEYGAEAGSEEGSTEDEAGDAGAASGGDVDMLGWASGGEDDGDDDGSHNGGDGGQAHGCGDGYIVPGEECDDGPDNGEGQACNADCQINVCGDGEILEGIEQCDDGANNGDLPAPCSMDCELRLPN